MKNYSLEEKEGLKKAQISLAKCLEFLERVEPKTEKVRSQMSIIALMGLAFELGLERVMHSSLDNVARAVGTLKHIFTNEDSSARVLMDALELAKKKDPMVLSKYLELQENEKEKEELMKFLRQKIDIECLESRELAIVLLKRLNKIPSKFSDN